MNSNKENNELPRPQILKLDDDFSLVKRFIDGDESAFRLIVQRHKERVRNIVYLTVGNTDAVDDISQDVFITVYNNLKNFRFESQFTTWLYRITVNKSRDHLRKKNVRKIFVPIDEASKELKNDLITEKSDVSNLVMNAILKLPQKLKTPLLLKDIEGFSYQEIAEIMECEIGTVKSRIFRAREGLRRILKPLEAELME